MMLLAIGTNQGKCVSEQIHTHCLRILFNGLTNELKRFWYFISEVWEIHMGTLAFILLI